MRPTRPASLATRFLVTSLFLLACAAVSHAQAPAKDALAGEYACTEARVAGKPVPCKASPLSLKTNGHFELAGREGEYLINGKSVELDGAALKSHASIEPGHKIVFRFYNRKGLCELIYERRQAELGQTHLS